jgi:hypothetical protein
LCWNANPKLKFEYLFKYDNFCRDSEKWIKLLHEYLEKQKSLSSTLSDKDNKALESIIDEQQNLIKVQQSISTSQLGLFTKNKDTQELMNDFVLLEKDNMVEDADIRQKNASPCSII